MTPSPATRARGRPARHGVVAWALGALLLLFLPARAPAQSRDVLVLEGGAAGRPFTTEFTSALSRAFDAQGADRPGVFFEWLDRDRFPDAGHLEGVRHYFATKYARRAPQVVVALGDPAVPFAIDTRDQLWPDAGLVAATNSEAMAVRVRQARRAVGLAFTIDLRGTIAAAIAVLPDTEALALVGASDGYLPRVETQLAAQFPGLRVIRIVDQPLADVRQRVAALPSHCVVLYTQYTLDPDGRTYVGRQVLTDLAQRANRPIVGFTSTYLGFGILAGSFRDITDTSATVARVVRRLLDGDAAEGIEARTPPPAPHFDARELKRWGIDEARVPAGSIVAYRTPTLWSQYRNSVIASAAVAVLQAVLIAALWSEVRRRRTAETQARQLSRRLFRAQEDERRRIARELHDGANQEIALFALQLDRSGHDVLAERARALATDLHRLSHELHPAILDQLGLVQALQQFGDQLRQVRALTVEVRASQWPTTLPPAVAVALYRVAQEALQNAARHSGAREAFVDLRATSSELSMTIADCGAGFGPPRTPAARLGLAGMQERLRGIGGSLSVETAREKGTTVVARIPRQALAAFEGPDRDPADPSAGLSDLTGAGRAGAG